MPGNNKNKYTIEYLPRVIDEDISKLDKKVKRIIEKKIETLIEAPLRGLPLRGNLAGCYKLKISKYRIIYKINNDKLLILILTIGKRENLIVYKIAESRLKLF